MSHRIFSYIAADILNPIRCLLFFTMEARDFLDLVKFSLSFVTIKTPVALLCKNHSCYKDIPFRNQKQKYAPCLLYMVRIL